MDIIKAIAQSLHEKTPAQQAEALAALAFLQKRRAANPVGIITTKEAAAAKADLHAFVKTFWKFVEPDHPFVDNWHIRELCDALQAVTRGEISRLVVSVPPGTGKSLLVSVFHPAWEWANNPALRFLTASYGTHLTIRDNLRVRDICQSDSYQTHYGLRFTGDQNVKELFKTTARGWRFATSVGGAGTGEHPDRIICLDGSSEIETDRGPIAIRKIVEGRLPVRVLGSSGAWQRIRKYESGPGRPMVEIEALGGLTLRCTEDHPVFVDGRGFIPASKLIELQQDGNIRLRLLRSQVRQTARTREAVQHGGTVLQSSLPRAVDDRSEPSTLDPSRLVAVRRCETSTTVFNIQTEPDHDYFANGILVHNCDDLLTAQQARSEAERENCRQWFKRTLSTRGVARKTRTIVIAQRLHADDLPGYLLKLGGWEHICFPMRFDPTRADKRDHRTETGTLLWPEVFSEAAVRQLEIDLDQFGAAAQLQQLPIPEGGGLFKRTWFEIVDEIPAAVGTACRGWDIASTEGAGDWTAGVKIRQVGPLFYVEDVRRGQWGPHETEKQMLLTANLDGKAVRQREEQEGGAAGKSVIAARARMLAGYDYGPAPTSGDKIVRARPFRAQCEAGNVKLKRGDWTEAYLSELEWFPNGSHDDQVDGSSAAFNELAGGLRPLRTRTVAWG